MSHFLSYYLCTEKKKPSCSEIPIYVNISENTSHINHSLEKPKAYLDCISYTNSESNSAALLPAIPMGQ